jgi:nitrogen regulatory protein PII
MHARKRIEIVVEAVQAERVTDLLDRLGAKGWTMLPVISGRGRQGLRQGGVPGGVFDNVLILCIASAELAERRGIQVATLRSKPGHVILRMVDLVGVIDWASVYAALALGIDPSPIGPIVALKERLAR